MSGLRHPVGEQDPRVYWARRIGSIALLVVVIVAVVVVVRTLGGGNGGHAAAPPVTSPTPSVASPSAGSGAGSSSPTGSPTGSPSGSASSSASGSASPTPSARGSSGPSASGTPSGTPSDAATLVPPGTATGSASSTATAPGTPGSSSTRAALPAACTNTQLQVDLMPATRRLTAGGSLTSQIVVHSSTAGCLARIAPSSLTVTVMSGSDRVWTSAQCTGTVPRRTVWVSRTVGDHFPVVWNGRRSSPECPSTPVEVARPGTYTVTATLGASSSPHRVVTID